MLKPIITKYKTAIAVSIIAVIWIFLFGSSFLGIYPIIPGFDVFKTKVFISTAIFSILVAYIGSCEMAGTSKVLNHVSEYRLPRELKEILAGKINDFEVPEIDIFHLLETMSADQKFYYSMGGNTYKERKFSLYAAKEDIHGSRRFVSMSYFIAKTSALYLDFGRKHISYYSITRIKDGYLETFFSNNRLTVTLNDSVMGYFDYTKKELCDAAGNAKGTFDSPQQVVVSMSLVSCNLDRNSWAGLNTGVITGVYSGNNKIADVNLLPSSKKRIEKDIESSKGSKDNNIRLFENLNVRSQWEAYMLLGFAVSEYAFVRTTFG
jgi:hypothetical protein